MVSGNSTGIYSATGESTAEVADNVVFFNGVGILVGGTVRDNRVYNNTTGIHVRGNAGKQLSGNLVYANTVGLGAYGDSFYGVRGDVSNNVFYANSQAAVRITHGGGLRIVNNTLYQPTGNAIEVSQQSCDIELRNNILWADSRIALSVSADSQFGFRSDYNLFAPAASGTLGRWQDRDFAARADWYWETGQDDHSLEADPQFVNPAGPDGLLGFSRAAIGPAVIIDNADPGFTTTGTWGTGSGGYSGNYRTHGVGDGSATATRMFTGLVPGTWYQVATTWQVNYDYWSEFADDAPFAILDGDGWLAQPRVNQNYRPNDFQDAGVGWRTLGYFFVTTDTLIVQLSDKIRYLAAQADAVRVQPVAGDGAADDNFRLQPGSPGVDRGEPHDYYFREPFPNGERIDVGAYGNTPQATASPAQMVQIVSPNG